MIYRMFAICSIAALLVAVCLHLLRLYDLSESLGNIAFWCALIAVIVPIGWRIEKATVTRAVDDRND
jgi:uncharacterized membrane protein YhaH (DUF805 family)